MDIVIIWYMRPNTSINLLTQLRWAWPTQYWLELLKQMLNLMHSQKNWLLHATSLQKCKKVKVDWPAKRSQWMHWNYKIVWNEFMAIFIKPEILNQPWVTAAKYVLRSRLHVFDQTRGQQFFTVKLSHNTFLSQQEVLRSSWQTNRLLPDFKLMPLNFHRFSIRSVAQSIFSLLKVHDLLLSVLD